MSNPFHKEFKEAVIAGLLQDLSFLREAASVVRVEHFEEQLYRIAIDSILKSYRETGGPPSRPNLLNDMVGAMAKENKPKNENDERALVLKPVDTLIARLYQPLNGDIADVKSGFMLYCQTQEMKAGLLEKFHELEQGLILPDQVPEYIRKLHSRAGQGNDLGMDFFATTADLKTEMLSMAGRRITTGFPSLDRDMKGGPAAGTLTLFVGKMKGGKSMTLVNAGYANLFRGKTVVVFTLEISKEVMRQRYASRISGVGLDDLEAQADKVIAAMNAFYEQQKGKLFIQEFMRGATVENFRSYLYSLESQKGVKPDVIIIDYGDLVRGAGRKASDSEFQQQDTAYVDMRALMKEFDAGGLTASQGTREALSKATIRMDDMASCIMKAAHCDHIVTINSTDVEALEKRARLCFVGTRQGRPGNIYPISADLDRCYMAEIKNGRVIHISQDGTEQVGAEVKDDGYIAPAHLRAKMADAQRNRPSNTRISEDKR